MDRTMYGKVDPGARQPFRTVMSKGTQPGYALLADLQSSVPANTEVQYNHNKTFDTDYGSLRRGPPIHETTSVTEEICSFNTTDDFYGNGRNMRQNEKHFTKKKNSVSELDSLLEDLSKGRYDAYDKKGHSFSKAKHQNQDMRPSVESLLNEMDTSLYSVPLGARPHKAPEFTNTVRETTVVKSSGVNGINDSKLFNSRDVATYPSYASSATKELDELMASLSDFKVNNNSNHHHQTITDFARPNKGVSEVTQIITETTSTVIEDVPQSDQLDCMLGNLQENMSRQGVNTVQKGSCNACEKPIVGQVITALGKTWHPEHFTCNHCNQELGTRNFFERDGFPYCESDYHNLFSPRCAYCNGAILDKCITALDKTWHTEHFFCAQCGQQFGEDGFHERDGKPYCRNDYFEMFAPKCNGCNRAIMENYISALNSQWHPDCFVCRDCKKAVRGKSFYAMEGKPVCPTCVGVDEEE